MQPIKYYTATQVASRWAEMYPFPICKRTIDNWRYLPGRGPAFVKSKGRVFYTESALQEFEDAGGVLRQGREA